MSYLQVVAPDIVPGKFDDYFVLQDQQRREKMWLAGVEDHLGAAEESYSFAGVDDGRVPDLRCASTVDEFCFALDGALALGAEEVALQLDGSEACGAIGQVRKAAVAACGVGERDHRGGV